MARVGKYVVTGEIRSSGKALFQSALDPVIGRPLAVKSIRKADAGAAGIAQLQREAQVAGGLHHPNIVTIYEYGEDAEHAWLAMERVQGKSLREHLQAGYRPELDALPELLAQLLEALDYAHHCGAVHGRLSADTVLVSGAGAAKLCDFGVRTGDEPADESADVHAAGLIVSEVLRGGAPEVPEALGAVLGKAVAQDPQQRFASARELLDALRLAFRPKPAALVSNVDVLRRAMRAAPPPAPAAVSPRRLPAVLFVDDEERVLNALSALFKPSFDVETATSGAAGLARLKDRRFLAVVSDQRMPEMTGVEFLRQAKALAPATVRILLTGYSDLAAIVSSVNESEVFRFASKPWQQEELKATLDEAVSVAIALEAAKARGTSAPKTAAAVLVLSDPAIARAVREFSRGGFAVLEAADSDSALALLAREEVGVLIGDLEANTDDPAAFLRVLKECSPQTQLIVASAASDSELVIGLINEARIHRFLSQPVNLSLLQQAVASALERYAHIAATPALARAENAKRGRDSAQARSFLQRIGSLGGRFAKALSGS